MRILLLGVGALALSAVGWICWRATAETREWRELLATNLLGKRTPAGREKFARLANRRVPEEGAPYEPWEMLVLEGSEGQRRILIGFTEAGGRSDVHLHVFDESYRRLSVTALPVEIHPCGLHFRPGDRSDPWSFGIDSLTPGSPFRSFYALKADRPVLLKTGK
jgi:hypothetical protein